MDNLLTYLRLRSVLLPFLALLYTVSGLCGQTTSPLDTSAAHLFSNTAYTLPVRYGGFALLHTGRYAVSRRVELGFHPVMVFLSPDVEVKWKHRESKRFALASFHSVNYPTVLLKTVQREGTGGLISPEFSLPGMVSFQNGVLFSARPYNRQTITGKVLFEFALNHSAPDKRSTIDLPVIYPRSAVYYKGYGFIAGAALEGKLVGRFSYLFTTNAYFFPRGGMQFFSEHQLGLILHTGRKFMLMGGGELTYGEYPYGPQWHLLPLLDFRWFLRI